jgi:integral membrane sensor domain MASE1
MNREQEKVKSEAAKIWQLNPGEVRKVLVNHVVMMALFTGIGVVVGTFGSLAVPLGFVTAFWPAQAIQSVGSIWYGMWGGIASFVFPMISNAISGSAPLPVSLAYIPGNLLQGMMAGIAFRMFQADPRLRTKRDWMIFIVFGVLLCNAIGAAWGSTVLRVFGLISPASHVTVFFGWMFGNSVPSFVLGALLLKFLSPLVIQTKTFCKKYWS